MYKRIESVKEIEDTVYQWDSGFWYDLDVSDKSLEEKQELLDTNVLFIKQEEK